MAVACCYHAVTFFVGFFFFNLPWKISGLSSPTGVTVRAQNGSDFIIITWNYQSDVTYYRIFFRNLHTEDGKAVDSIDTAGPFSVYCVDPTCHYCVANSNAETSCSQLNEHYKFSIGSELDYENVVSVKVEACADVLPNTCTDSVEWKNYTIPPGAPSAVRNVHARPHSSKTVEVMWTEPEQTRGRIILYYVYYRKRQDKVRSQVFLRGTNGILRDLTAGTNYTVWVTASTAASEGDRSNVTFVETYKDECISSPCQHSGICSVTGHRSYECRCSAAWQGSNCHNPKGYLTQQKTCINIERKHGLFLRINVTLESCAAKCNRNASCKSFEFGRGLNSSGVYSNELHLTGTGECKLFSGDSKRNELQPCLYNYYEKKGPVIASSVCLFPSKLLLQTASVFMLILHSEVL